MIALRWLYNRLGQMVCFGYGALALTFGASSSSAAAAIAGSGLLLTGVGLKAIFHWRQMDDPDLV